MLGSNDKSSGELAFESCREACTCEHVTAHCMETQRVRQDVRPSGLYRMCVSFHESRLML
eukprot:5018927-Prymnesium_polylepis.1